MASATMMGISLRGSVVADLLTVANLPAEIAHLLEEIQAKDKTIQECRSTITARDSSLQKFVRMNGSLAPNPKEEAYNKTILANYDRAQALQEEKVVLSEKAGVLLDRHVRRLDSKIRDLQNEGTMPLDPPLPSLLHPSPANRGSTASTPGTGATTPLNPISSNSVPSTTIANSEIARLAHPAPAGQRSNSPNTISGTASHRPLLGGAHSSNSAPSTPAAGGILHQRHRESSTGAINDAKRRRLNAHLNTQPTTSSSLARTSSLGPGGPKAGTPPVVRAGSAGPRPGTKKSSTKKLAPHQQQMRKKLSNKSAGSASSNGLQKRAMKKSAGGPGIKPSPTSTDADNDGDDDDEAKHMLSDEGDGSDEEMTTPPPGSARGGSSGAGAATAAGPASSGSHIAGRNSSARDADGDTRMGGGAGGHGGAMGSAGGAGGGGGRGRGEGGGGGAAGVLDGGEAEAEDEDGANDDRKYCTCRNVSYGNMVACDNDDCPYEWFHWQCVGMTKEPIGKWFCDECRAKMGHVDADADGAAGGAAA